MHPPSGTPPVSAALALLADEELVQVARRRRTAKEQEEAARAFQVLYQRYGSMLLSYLTHQVSSAESAQDLTQETFLKAWKGLPRMWGGEHVRAWLFQIAINETKLYWRRQKLKEVLSLERLLAPLVGPSREQEIPGDLNAPAFEEVVSEQECISRALKQLPSQYRACLLLYDQYGFKQAEIAQLLQIEESTVSSNLYRARERFRQLYHQELEDGKPGRPTR